MAPSDFTRRGTLVSLVDLDYPIGVIGTDHQAYLPYRFVGNVSVVVIGPLAASGLSVPTFNWLQYGSI